MSLANYTDLKASVASWLNRTDLTATIPDFITIGEARINTDARLREQITAVTLSTVAATQSVALPADWLEFKALTIAGLPLEYMPADRLRERSTTGAQSPTHYALEGASLLLSPTPNTVYSISVQYYAKVPALATATTNWLLTKYPNIYLYASLVSACHYTKNNDGANYWGGLYTQAMAVATAADMRALSSGSPLTVRQRRPSR